MANELRARDGMLAGTLDIDHTSGATTLTAAILAAHRAIGSTMHSAWVISDPAEGKLAGTVYNPGTLADNTTTSTSAAAADATNLKVTFVAPRSGKVRVRLHGTAKVSSNAVGYFWSVVDGSNVIQGTAQFACHSADSEAVTVDIPLAGLTPGTSYTYYWGHHLDAAGTGHLYVGGASPNGAPATMDVLDDSAADSPANSEIVYVTAHTAAAGTATILRGQEGTTAQAWKAGSRIVHGPTIRDFAGDTAWTDATLTSPWTTYSGGGYSTHTSYRKSADGLVMVRGHITSGTATGTVFTLPVGYRPANNVAFACPAYNGSAWGSAQVAVNIQSSGVVEILGPAPSSGWVIALDSIRLWAEA